MKRRKGPHAKVVAMIAVAGIAFAWAIGAHALAFAGRQAAAQDRPQMAEQVFKNIQVLKGIPVDEFLDTMGIMCAALGADCADCHTGAGTDQVKWELDTPRKRTARRMTLMVAAINRDNFPGRQMVTCWTCHRGRDIPLVMPSIDTVYGTPLLEPDDIIARPSPGEPSPDQILAKYVTALGGAERLASVTSFIATGTSQGFRGFGGGGQVQIFAKAPDQRATIIRFAASTGREDAIRTFDGRNGWVATPLAVVRDVVLSPLNARVDHETRNALAVERRVAERGLGGFRPAIVQVQIAFPREAHAAVNLDPAVADGAAGVARVHLGDRHRHGRVGRPLLQRPCGVIRG